jgi:hypothetical protein
MMLGFNTVQSHAGPAGAPQASITLNGSDVALCNMDDTSWSISKTGTYAPTDSMVQQIGTVSWTVTATKVAVSDKMLKVNGFVRVTNTGSANATIGNIVVNLQRQVLVGTGKNKKTYWISAAADMADSTMGDASTHDNIVAAASAEDPAINLSNGPHNYVVSGAMGTFTETPGVSGPLEFTDANNNSTFSLNPQISLAPGASINLMFTACFNNTVLHIADGEQVRAEVIVSFGNSGARGGSGASAANIDINGDGAANADEANVRSVPTRITKAVPATEHCNASVTLTDPGPETVTGTVVASGFNSGLVNDFIVVGMTGTTIDPVGTTYHFYPSVNVDGGTDGGTVGNEAFLDSDGDYAYIYGPVDPLTGMAPILYTFPCCNGIHISGGDVVTVPGAATVNPDSFKGKGFTTYTQAHWGNKKGGGDAGGDAAAAAILSMYFGTVYPGGSVSVGGNFTMKFTSAAAVAAYLGSPGGADSALTANLVNPTSSSSGALGGALLALQLNVNFTDAGFLGTSAVKFGDLKVLDPGGSLDMQSVRQVLAAANVALGGGALPSGYTYVSLGHLVSQLNLAFDQGHVHGFANNLLSY